MICRAKYQSIKDEWCGVPDVFDSTKVLEVGDIVNYRTSFTHFLFFVFRQERHRIDVDCRRTDRNQPMFSAPAEIPTTDLDDEKAQHQQAQKHYSIISPNMSDIGAQSPSNEHVDRMAGILLTYNFYEKELGMSPLLAGYCLVSKWFLGCGFDRFESCRLCPGHVRLVCTFVYCHGRQRGAGILVLC